MTKDDSIELKSCGGTKGSIYDSVLDHSELDYLFCVNKDLDCWLIPLEAIRNSGNTKEIKLRKEQSKYANPKLDTTIYRVQFSNEE